MLLFIGSEAMLFGSFFAAYFFVRVVNHDSWPAHGTHLPVFVAGINTANAKTDTDAVIAAYPNAEINGTPGVNGTLVDWLLGIEVKWTYDGYTGAIHVGMRIFEPLASLPTVAAGGDDPKDADAQ